MFTFMTGCFPECGGAAGTNNVTSLDLNDMHEKRSDMQSRTSVNGSESKHESTQLETSKTLLQSPNGTQEDSATGLGMDHIDESDIDKENLKRSDPSKLWCLFHTIISEIFKLKYFLF